MNVRGGWALVRRSWASWLQYRSFFFLLAFGWMLAPLIYLFVWSTAAGGTTVGGMTSGEFVAYYLLLILVNQVTLSQANWTLGEVIRGGGLSAWLLRPVSPMFNVLSTDIAGKVVEMVFVLPVAGLLALLLRPELHTDLFHVLAFVPSLAMAWALRFAWCHALAMLAFWATRADALLVVQDSLTFVLGGQVAPIALLPGALHWLAVALPFRYMLGFPVEVLSGRLDGPALLTGFALQMAWLLVASSLARLAWVRGVRRYSAVGG